MSVQPGDRLVAVDSGWGGPTIRRTGTVKRVTPTGIIVMDNDDRLKPAVYRDNAYEVRGGSGWHRQTYYTADHEVVKAAHENTRKRESAHRKRESAHAVISAFDEWKSARDAETARALAKAAREFAKGCDA